MVSAMGRCPHDTKVAGLKPSQHPTSCSARRWPHLCQVLVQQALRRALLALPHADHRKAALLGGLAHCRQTRGRDGDMRLHVLGAGRPGLDTRFLNTKVSGSWQVKASNFDTGIGKSSCKDAHPPERA